MKKRIFLGLIITLAMVLMLTLVAYLQDQITRRAQLIQKPTLQQILTQILILIRVAQIQALIPVM